MAADDPRIALRPFPSDTSRLDDLVIRNVEMFRAEMLDNETLWMACYLPGTGVEGDRIAFHVRVHKGALNVAMVEGPQGSVSFE
jgi:hypothetical protein